MKRIVLAVALALGLGSPAMAQSDPVSDFFGALLQPSVSANVRVSGLDVRAGGGIYLGRRHHGFGGRVAVRANPEIISLVNEVAAENGVNPALAHAVIRIESGYNCHAHNGAAAGIMQTNYRTAASMGVPNPVASCRAGLVAGMRYLRRSIEQHGYGCAAFSAYQSGLGVHRCSAYGRRVIALMSGHDIAPAYAGRRPRYASYRHRLIRYASVRRHYRHYASS